MPAKSDKARPLAVDLFAGAGGLSLGVEKAGFDIVAAVEAEPLHCAVHTYNFPDSVDLCADVATLSGKEILTRAGLKKGQVDLVCGGPPCQGFSLIGRRSLEDPRNELVYHFVRLVVELGAKYFLFENVRGLTLGPHRKFLDEVIRAFEAEGYDVVKPYKVLNAVNFGVPQDRQRLFLLGAKRGLPLPHYPTAETRHPLKADRAGLPPAPTVWDAIGDLPSISKIDELWETDVVRLRRWKKTSSYAKLLREEARHKGDYGYRRAFDPLLLTASRLTAHTPTTVARFCNTPCGSTEAVSRFMRLRPDGVCNTLRAGTGPDKGSFMSPRPIHPKEPRCITVREAARLHSFPDWFRFHTTKWHGFRQVGNSVPPLLAKAVASRIVEALGYEAARPRRTISLGEVKLVLASPSEAKAYLAGN